MVIASAVELLLIACAMALVVWKAGRIERATDALSAAAAMQQSEVNMAHQLHRQGGAVWQAVLGPSDSQQAFTDGARAFRTEWETFARGATSADDRAFAGRLGTLHEEYTALGLSVLTSTGSAVDSGRGAASSGLLRLVALQQQLVNEMDRQAVGLAAANVRAAQGRLLTDISGMLATLSVISVGLLLSLGLGLLAMRHYLVRTVQGFARAADSLESDDVPFRLDWAGPAEFEGLAARFNHIQERLQSESAAKARIETREAEMLAELNTEIAAKVETLRVVQRAAHAWRDTFDAVDFVLLTVDRHAVVQRVNRAALNLLGGGFDDWIGRPLSEFPDRQPWRAVRALLDDVFTGGRPLNGQIGDETVWEYGCTGLPSGGDGLVVWARDISQMAELRRIVARSEAMGAMGELLAGVAHEVRNPLFAITALLDAWSLKPQLQEGPFLPALRREVARMRQLMDELLEYGRPFNPSLVVRDLQPVAVESVRILAPAARERDITINVNVAGLVHMDEARMLRVFLNLVQNAIDHSPQGSTIDVVSETVAPKAIEHSPPGTPVDAGDEKVTERSRATVRIAVRDRGPGFDESNLTRVFHPFFTRRPGGTGLGLPIVQRIVDEHGGKVSAGNHPDGGALIRVELPIAAWAAPA
jgi:signal transduction histidine kinase